MFRNFLLKTVFTIQWFIRNTVTTETFKYLRHYYYITMVMDTLQIRMNKGLLKRVDTLVKSGVYSNRSDVIRDAVRRFVWEKEVGSISNKWNAVEQTREIRKKLSEEKIDLDEINNL